MSRLNHPDMEMLAEYIEKPDAKNHTSIRLHLAACSSCRQNVFNLSATVEKVAKYVPRQTLSVGENVSSEVIATYVDNELAEHSRAQVQKQIKSDPMVLKAALHYATHSATMQAALVQEQGGLSVSELSLREKIQTLFQSMLTYFSWRPPLWASVPVTAGFMVIVFLSIGFFSALPVTNYQDQPYMTWQDQPFETPGMAFFNAANQELTPSKRIRFELKKKSLRVSWEAIEDAMVYKLQVTYVNKKGDRLVKKLETKNNGTIIDDFSARPEQRYSWRLSGKTVSHRYFQMQGGFVIPSGS